MVYKLNKVVKERDELQKKKKTNIRLDEEKGFKVFLKKPMTTAYIRHQFDGSQTVFSGVKVLEEMRRRGTKPGKMDFSNKHPISDSDKAYYVGGANI